MPTSPPLQLTTRLFVRELSDGSCIAAPVVEPALASHGDETTALLEQSLFLREHFARATGEIVSRFAIPEDTRLITIEVDVPREELPRRLAFEMPIAFSCVVMPARNDEAWIAVPVLDHVFYLRKGENLEAVARAEIRRVALARDLTAYEHTRLYPSEAQRLEPVAVQLRSGLRGTPGVSRTKQISDFAKREKAARALASIGTPLHIEGAKTPPPLVGRDRELAELTSLLTGRERLSGVLTGPENAGKSAIVRAFIARAIASGKAPLVYQTSGAQLIAGMSGFGQWQERIKSVLEAAKAVDAILYFEDMADLLAERATGNVDFPGAMKPYLEDNDVRVLGEMRPEGLDEAERRHPALLASLHRIRVEPLDAAKTQEVLRQRAAHDARYEKGRPEIQAAAIAPLVDLADRYLPYGAFPGKAVRLYEDLRALREGEAGGGDASQARPVSVEHVYEMFSRETGVPSFLLRESTPLTIPEVEVALRRFVAGQHEAVRRLAETIVVVKAGLQPPNKPLATFLFVGPTGVGKTELAKATAHYLFGSVDKLVRFDMSEFMTPDAAERLIRGTDKTSGVLTRKVREQPFCVLLLDEIEKAHPAVFDLLLQVTGEGRLTDARGQTASFQNAILIMTSNLGAADRRAEVGLDLGARRERDEANSAHYVKYVESAFRPELVNRLDKIIVFSPLGRDELATVADLSIEKIRSRPGLVDLGVSLTVTDAAKAHLAAGGYSATMGARALRRHLEEAVVAPASRLLAALGGDMSGAAIDVSTTGEEQARDPSTVSSLEEGGLRIRVRRRRSDRAALELSSVGDVASLRRLVERVMRLDEVVRVKERIDLLTTDLATIEGGRRDPRKASDIAEMMSEHHRLSELWKRVDAARLDVHSAEELVLMALFDGTPQGPMLAEARIASRRFRAAAPYLMLALEPERDHITLMIEELDTGAFDRWLFPFFDMIASHRWQAMIHIDGGKRVAEDQWPAERRWGPPRTIGHVERALGRREAPSPSAQEAKVAEDPKRRIRNLLLRVQGSYAGSFLSVEQGLHRLVGTGKNPPDDVAALCVHFVALHTRMKDKDWEHPIFNPPDVATAETRRKGQAAREFDLKEETITLTARRVTLPATVESFFEDHDAFALEHILALHPDPKLAREVRAGRKAG